MTLIDKLPTEILIQIFSSLSYKDLVSCSSVSSRFHDVSETNKLWQVECQKIWQIKPSLEEKNTLWKPCFIHYFSKFGRYLKCYAQIKDAWDKIIDFMAVNCKEIHETMKDGASEEDIAMGEQLLGLPFPEDYRCSLLLHNGQTHRFAGVMGSVLIHSHHRTETLLDVTFASICESVLPGCIPVTACLESGIVQHMALDNRHGLERGTIFYPSDIPLFRTSNHFNAFISGRNFLEWLTTYANHLARGDFLVKDGQLYRFHMSCDRALKTDAITVTARTCFMPEFSSVQRHNFFHTYEITMTMDSDAPAHKSCQLETRHWIVASDDGHEEHVSGAGVIGEFPIMRPGSSFSWVSCTNFRTTHGSMKGHFTMRNLSTGDKIDVLCPTYHMKSMPYISNSITGS